MTEIVTSDATAAMSTSSEPPVTNSAPPGGAVGSDDEEEEGKTKGSKSRRELPAGAVATLKAWLLSPEHFTHPYPTPQDQVLLMQKTGIDKKQLKNWFTNARRRIWKPMLKKHLEQGKLAQTGGGGGAVVIPGTGAAGLVAAQKAAHDFNSVNVGAGSVADPNIQIIQQNYQQVMNQQTSQPQQQQQQNTFDNTYSTNVNFAQQQQHQQNPHPGAHISSQNNSFNYYQQQNSAPFVQQQGGNDTLAQNNTVTNVQSMPGGTLPNLNKTDSHAVLMELFARDQDLVRQATECAKQRAAAAAVATGDQHLAGTAGVNAQTQMQGNNNNSNINNNNGQGVMGSQHPMSNKMGNAPGNTSINKLGNVPSLNSWPHFSSVSSLNNLTMTGVKSITNMSGADLVSMGSLNKKGNLAHIKSLENTGRADSYAFLEVFFDNPNTSGGNDNRRGIKRDRDEDDNVGLSLDGDDTTSLSTNTHSNTTTSGTNIKAPGAPTAAPLPPDGKDNEGLKRAYDDAMAARGLISVSRSSEKLTDLVLPSKMQRTLSQEYLKSMNSGGSTTFTSYSFASNSPQASAANTSSSTIPTPVSSTVSNQQYPGQPPQQQYQNSLIQKNNNEDPSPNSTSVEVPATTKCALCGCINVDTQLRPCGHMFHGRCLKPSLQQAMGPPKCPIDHITMQSAVLAVPTVEVCLSITTT